MTRLHFYGAMIDPPPSSAGRERCKKCGGSGVVCTHPDFENKVKYAKCKECDGGWITVSMWRVG